MKKLFSHFVCSLLFTPSADFKQNAGYDTATDRKDPHDDGRLCKKEKDPHANRQ